MVTILPALRQVREDLANHLARESVDRLCQELGHHPDIHLAWGKVGVEIWAHKINGLSESDFILAAKYDHVEPPQ